MSRGGNGREDRLFQRREDEMRSSGRELYSVEVCEVYWDGTLTGRLTLPYLRLVSA